MQTESLELLKTLIRTPSPSGFEEPVQRIVKKTLAGLADEVSSDVHGNVIGARHPDGRPRVLLTGHADEIGLMIKYVNDEGYLYFQPIGSVPTYRLEGHRVTILNERGPALGVIARKKPADKEEAGKELKHHDFWIDIGAEGRAAAEARVAVGDPAVLDADLAVLHGDRVIGRGFDDRIGVFIMLEVMRRLRGVTFDAAVYGVSMVQEEAGSRGAWTCAYNLAPEVGIAIDVHETTDYPETDKRINGALALGKGPILAKGTNFNPRLASLLVETAREHRIPYQFAGTPMPTWTDASVLQIARGGSAACVVGVPLRYMHTSAEVIALSDVEHTIALLAGLIPKLTADLDFKPI